MAMNAPPPEMGSGGDTIMGIPKKYAIIGGGAAALGLVFFMLKRSGGTATGGASDMVSTDANGMYGQALGPNAALALGDLQHNLSTESGKLQEQQQLNFEKMAALLDSAAKGLSDEDSTRFATLMSGQSGITDLLGLHSEEARARQQQWYDNLTSGQAGLYDLLGRQAGEAAAQRTQYYNNVNGGSTP